MEMKKDEASSEKKRVERASSIMGRRWLRVGEALDILINFPFPPEFFN